ncbi:MAG TPA: hypothetical protein VG734_07675 [Lacunisphaera sp.]|nr:hypothetical protein [Lacunisphaera sp.]
MEPWPAEDSRPPHQRAHFVRGEVQGEARPPPAGPSIKENGRETWSDSMEHYGAADARLDAEMAESILSYVQRVMRSDLTAPVSLHEEESE